MDHNIVQFGPIEALTKLCLSLALSLSALWILYEKKCIIHSFLHTAVNFNTLVNWVNPGQIAPVRVFDHSPLSFQWSNCITRAQAISCNIKDCFDSVCIRMDRVS